MSYRKHIEITVTGTGRFPLDMLRFGQLYPKDIESVVAMEPSEVTDSAFRRDSARSATLCMFGSCMSAYQSIQRFESFGWTGEITFEEGNENLDRSQQWEDWCQDTMKKGEESCPE